MRLFGILIKSPSIVIVLMDFEVPYFKNPDPKLSKKVKIHHDYRYRCTQTVKVFNFTSGFQNEAFRNPANE